MSPATPVIGPLLPNLSPEADAPRVGGRRPNAKRAAPKGRPSRVVTILLRNR
jgi:hypothetical protein